MISSGCGWTSVSGCPRGFRAGFDMFALLCEVIHTRPGELDEGCKCTVSMCFKWTWWIFGRVFHCKPLGVLEVGRPLEIFWVNKIWNLGKHPGKGMCMPTLLFSFPWWSLIAISARVRMLIYTKLLVWTLIAILLFWCQGIPLAVNSPVRAPLLLRGQWLSYWELPSHSHARGEEWQLSVSPNPATFIPQELPSRRAVEMLLTNNL